MSDIAIKVENLSKRYRLGLKDDVPDTFADVIKGWLKSPMSNYRQLRSLSHFNENGTESDDVFWALKDVSFEVKQGEVIGIIGRNGAGKSTLLKILSRITEPTSGRAVINGRVSSLLEVGTGFHPELTGRENVYLNGTILGMTKKEIDRKFDEIVDFSGVERFIDTPVKRYSSGMQVRLAFAVAAHLEPEILVIDEVLAVGDVEFQKKCLGKMGDIAGAGRTVLFVSHNMGAVTQLCSTGILLEHGIVKGIGNVDRIVRDYIGSGGEDQASMDLTDYQFRRGTQEVKIEWAQLRDVEQSLCREFSIGDDIVITFGMKTVPQHINKRVKVAIQMRSVDGIQLCNIVDVDSGFHIDQLRHVEVLSIRVQDIRFYPGTYYISIWVGNITSTDTFDYIEDCLSFEIIGGGKLTTRRLPREAGILFLTPEWKQEEYTVMKNV